MRISLLFFLVSVTGMYAQRDSISSLKTISRDIKTLQFGANYRSDLGEFVERSEKNVTQLQPTEFYKNYYQEYLHYDPERDPKRLVYDTGLYLGAALASFGILWVLPESFTKWNKEEILDYGLFNKWKDNVRAGPVWDEDGFFLNWIMHPWAGGVYYMSARGSGFKIWESFAYSAIMSTLFWEYGIEAFAEIPSWQDLLVTPILGSLLGEQFFRWKGKIINNERKILNSRLLGGVSLFIMDPFNQILDSFGYKTKNKIKTYSYIVPIGYDVGSSKTIWGMQVLITF